MGTVEQRLEEWSKDLLDLSFRNRLLNLPRLGKNAKRQSTLELGEPDASEIFRAIADERTLSILNPPDPEDEQHLNAQGENNTREYILPENCVMTTQPESIANRIALRLLRQSRASTFEQGINILYMASGVLKWKDSKESRDRYSPLLLFPVTITEDARKQQFQITRLDDAPEFNLTLAERLQHDFGIRVQPENTEDGAEELDYDRVTAHVRQHTTEREGWEVLEEVHIGLFQFHKLRMFQDLKEHIPIAASHEIIQALAIDGVYLTAASDSVYKDDELDTKLDPKESFSVLDADTSQLRAIETIKRGSNLIIQGPPGTGKSQTIANVIAECIAQGKKVLFVSEKSAALEVVHNRLQQAGLEEYCLSLHSHKANKSQVIDELYQRMEFGHGQQELSDLSTASTSLSQLRYRLNEYPKALHSPREPLGKSVFWAFEELAQLDNIESYPTIPAPDLTELSHGKLGEWQDSLSRVASHYDVLRDGNNHAWSGIVARSLTPNERSELLASITQAVRTLSTLRQMAHEVAHISGLPVPDTFSKCQELAQIVAVIPLDQPIRPAWTNQADLDNASALLKDAAERAKVVEPQATGLFANFTDAVMELPHSELLSSYDRNILNRLFSSEHRRHRATVKQTIKPAKSLSVQEEASGLRTAASVRTKLDWFQKNNDALERYSGKVVDQLSTLDVTLWDHDIETLNRMSSLLSTFGDQAPPAPFISAIQNHDRILHVVPMNDELRSHINTLEQAAKQISGVYSSGAWTVDSVSWHDADFELLKDWLNHRLAHFNDLDAWTRAQLTLKDAEDKGLSNVIHALQLESLEPQLWPRAIRKIVLENWVRNIETADPVLRDFFGDDHERRIEAFRTEDRFLIETAAARLIHQLRSRAYDYSLSNVGEPNILKREALKKRRKLALRSLFQKIPNLLLAIKPCLMMSPLSVAHYLSADQYKFDVVIFDEAS